MVQLSPILAGLGPGQSNRDMGGKNGHMTPKEGRRGIGGSDNGGFRKEIGDPKEAKKGHEKQRDQ